MNDETWIGFSVHHEHKRWIILPRVLMEGLGEAIRAVVDDGKTGEYNQEMASRLLRLAASWGAIEREAR